MTVSLSSWQNQLATVGSLRQTGGAADLAATQEETRNVPAAFAILEGEQSTPSRTGTQYIAQTVTQTVGIVIAVSNMRDQSGQAALADLESVRSSILLVLHGKLLTGASTPIEHIAGDVQAWNASTLWWLDRYRLTFFRRTASN